MTESPPRLAIVLPCYNEEEVLPLTARELNSLLAKMIEDGIVSAESFILYVDDGSTDSTWSVIANECSNSSRTAGLRLAANSGHQNCVLAGLTQALPSADAIITIDADLQDDVKVIPQMMTHFANGCDVVYGVRANRDADSAFKRHSAQLYYRTLKLLGVKTVYNHAGFRLLSARAVAQLLKYDERNLYLRGIVPMLGYQQAQVTYSRQPRRAGTTKYSVRKMLHLGFDGITSFSVKPVRLVSLTGLIFVAIALIMLIYALVRYFSGATIEGWTSLILSVWFCSGMILLSLGIVGEYIGKIYTEVKHRPRYAISDSIPLHSKKSDHE